MMQRFLSSLFLLAVAVASQAQTYDLVIKGGKIVDGSGNSWFYADLGIKDGRIGKVGMIDPSQALRVIDAKGLIVAPGFIDVHTHIEGNDLKIPTAGNFIFDGVTSVVTGNCGSSNTDVSRYFFRLDSVRMSLNVATLIGHNSVRRAVMGDGQRDPLPEEQAAMEAMVVKAMQDGAVGLSTGLIYVPGTYSKTAEVVALAKASAKYNGVYVSHIRDEGDDVTAAVDEAIHIGRTAQMPVEISHFKVTYKPNWGQSVNTLSQVERARQEGVDVTIDQYPYVASSTTLNILVPSWVFSGGKDSLLWRLNDAETRKRIKAEMLAMLKHKQLKNYNYALVARYGADTTVNGKTISQINILKGRKNKAADEVETVLEMVANGSAQMVYFSMDESDLRRIMQYPFNMFASDAGIVRYSSGVPHPRAYGTNARVLGLYVRSLAVLRLEEAVRRMTSLPAQRFQLKDRGLLREGFAADVVVFDEKTVGDLSTFQQPHAYSSGFRFVIVNGVVTLEDNKHTGARAGTILYGPGSLMKSAGVAADIVE
ncbi:MAG TPA: D-aminoacylase [Chryseosolibacter sp.]|nr:D-aminoacylase [Chryseosolibacter sp.]